MRYTVIVHSARPTVLEVQTAIRDALACGKRSIEDVAQALFVSTRALQRLLAAQGKDFTELRREVQIQVALGLLTQGKSASAVAGEVGLSRDHLCVLIRHATDLTPSQIIRATRLVAKVQRWHKFGPPAYGSRLYREQFREWQEIDAGLQRLLVHLDAHHPLAAWAKKLLVDAARPDFRTQAHRGHVRARRKREADELAARIRRADDLWRLNQRYPAILEGTSPTSDTLGGDHAHGSTTERISTEPADAATTIGRLRIARQRDPEAA